MNEAAILAARRGLKELSKDEIADALERIVAGPEKKGAVVSEKKKRLVAYHEAGHAIVARTLPGSPKPHKLTIVPRVRSLGHCTLVDDVDRTVYSRTRMIDRMAAFLGGRVAEQLVLGEVSSGAASDLRVVSDLAREMVSELGMSDVLGPQVFVESPGRRAGRQRWSEASVRTIDSEVAALIAGAEERARGVLGAARPALDRLAQALLEQETLSSDDMDKLLGPAVTADGAAPPRSHRS